MGIQMADNFITTNLVSGFFQKLSTTLRSLVAKKCPHGNPIGVPKVFCIQCLDEEIEAKIKKMELENKERRVREVKRLKNEIWHKSMQIRQQEMKRLRSSFTISLDEMRQLTPQKFEDFVAGVFRSLGYSVEQTPYTNDGGRDAILIKNNKKMLLECKKYGQKNQSGRPDLQKFYAAIIGDNAEKGFFVTTGGFSKEARKYAQTVPIDLIDGPILIKMILESRSKFGGEKNYFSVCQVCGDIVELRLEASKTVCCRHGHIVPHSITMEELASSKDFLDWL